MTAEQFKKQYPIITSTFEYGDVYYNIALAPEYYRQDDGLDFTGSYECLLISSEWGTKAFQVLPAGNDNWELTTETLVPGIVKKITDVIKQSRP